MGACATKIPAEDVQLELQEELAAGPVRFESVGPGLQLLGGGLGVLQTKGATHAFALVTPVLHSGTASATFELVFKGAWFDHWGMVVGVFPADHKLDSRIDSADGKRCALWVDSLNGDYARVLCDGEQSDPIRNIGWQPSDKIKVDVTFTDATTARVTLRFKGHTKRRTLEGVPACGLRFGVGLLFEGTGVSLVASSVEVSADRLGSEEYWESAPSDTFLMTWTLGSFIKGVRLDTCGEPCHQQLTMRHVHASYSQLRMRLEGMLL